MEDYIVDARQAYRQTKKENSFREAPPENKEEIQNKFFFVANNDNPENYRELNNIIPGGYLEPDELKFIRKAQQQLALIEFMQDRYDVNLADSAMFFDRIIKFLVHSSKSKRGFATRSLNRQEVVQDEKVSQLQRQQVGQQGNGEGLTDKFKRFLNNSGGGQSQRLAPKVDYGGVKRKDDDMDDFW